jgi:hypothetical protein
MLEFIIQAWLISLFVLFLITLLAAAWALIR